MRAVAALIVSASLAVVPAVASGQVAPREVQKSDYLKVEKHMARDRVERILGVGKGCEYISYEIGEVLFTGRQYRNSEGGMVAVRYAVRGDGVERVRGKQWNTVESC